MKKKKEWAQIEFRFPRRKKQAYALGRWLLFLKEMGILPATVELQLNEHTVVIGHWKA